MTTALTEKPIVGTVRNLLAENRDQFAKLLPKIVSPERFLATIVATVQDNQDLQDCTVQSLVRCVLQCAQLGLMPGPRRMAYLVPFNNNKTKKKEAQLIVGYLGLLQLCRNSGMIANVDAHCVYDGDGFDYGYGTEPFLKHAPKSPWRRNMAAEHGKQNPEAWDHITDVYAWAKLTNGELKICVLTKEQIDWHRDRYSKASKVGPWRDDFPAMACKTALRELCNLLPSSEERQDLAKAVTLDKQAEADVQQTLDVPFEIKGLAEIEEQTAQPETHDGSVPCLPDYAPQGMEHCKGKPVNSPEVTDANLAYYAKLHEDALKNPRREKFRATDQAVLDAIRTEQADRASRKVQTADQLHGEEPPKQAAKPSQLPQDQPKAKAQGETTGLIPPPEGFPIGEEAWQVWRMQVEEQHHDLYYAAKEALGFKQAQPIPVAQRQDYYRKFQELLKG